jgi:glucose-6-phosphate isomerase
MALTFSAKFDCTPDMAAAEAAHAYVQAALDAGSLGFATLPYQDEPTLAAITNLANEVRERFKTILIIGIGGSDLGTRAVHRALNHQFYNLREQPRLFFIGDTTDPVALAEVLEVVDLQETVVVMVSKSGNTVEQMGAFLIVRDQLIAVVGERYHEHIIAITDPEKGAVRELVNLEGYRSLPIPPTVGGRFSVLSAVGLFPLAVVGIDIYRLLEGARYQLEHNKQDSLRYAAMQHASYLKGQIMHVMMPYNYALREVGFWFRQLWAESLGKAHSLSGQEIHVGPTPIAALGPTDQHSQVQLYREGPADKTFTFIAVNETPRDIHIPQEVPAVESLQYLRGLSLDTILKAELDGTEASLQEVGRSTCRITIDCLDAWNVGALLIFFELATAYAGSLFAINPYDQPGVERGKEITRDRLQHPGV